ncbi:MAG: hypothetical protein IKI04_01185 [Bacilli bacterium]|nr:hypothetical protein [Bacilli bacterium]
MDDNKDIKKEDIKYVSFNEKDEDGDYHDVYGYIEENEDNKNTYERVDEIREFLKKHR